MDEIISSKRSFYDKFVLRYKKIYEGSSSKGKEIQRIYADFVQGFEPQNKDIQKVATNKSHEEDRAWKQPPAITKFQDSNFRIFAPTRISSTSRYQNIFFGICYSYNNFGHKVVNCRAYVRGETNEI